MKTCVAVSVACVFAVAGMGLAPQPAPKPAQSATPAADPAISPEVAALAFL